jgi:hypothetical protein
MVGLQSNASLPANINQSADPAPQKRVVTEALLQLTELSPHTFWTRWCSRTAHRAHAKTRTSFSLVQSISRVLTRRQSPLNQSIRKCEPAQETAKAKARAEA